MKSYADFTMQVLDYKKEKWTFFKTVLLIWVKLLIKMDLKTCPKKIEAMLNARNRMWWPGIESDIEHYRSCITCVSVGWAVAAPAHRLYGIRTARVSHNYR